MKKIKNIILTVVIVMAYFLAQTIGVYAQTADQQGGSQKKSTGGGSDIGSFNSQTSQPYSDSVPLSPITIPNAGMNAAAYFYNVHVLGEVLHPGTYRVLSSDRLTDAIKYSGGLLVNGSQRRIQLRRQGTTRGIDLFSYKYRGSLNDNPYLTEDDVVFVPPKSGEIEIEGPVARPGRWEILKSASVKSAIDLAGGFVSGRSLKDPIRIIRFDAAEKKQVIPVENTNVALEHTALQKGDVVVVPHILTTGKSFDYNLNRIPGDNMFYPSGDDKVYVIGAVSQPGAFNFLPSASYKQYVNMAGPAADARIKKVKLIRRDGKKVYVKADTVISPGDTLFVPDQYWKAGTVLVWLTSLTSLALTSVLISNQVK